MKTRMKFKIDMLGKSEKDYLRLKNSKHNCDDLPKNTAAFPSIGIKSKKAIALSFLDDLPRNCLNSSYLKVQYNDRSPSFDTTSKNFSPIDRSLHKQADSFDGKTPKQNILKGKISKNVKEIFRNLPPNLTKPRLKPISRRSFSEAAIKYLNNK